MKGINCKRLTVTAVLLGMGIVGAMGPAQAAPRNEYRKRRTMPGRNDVKRSDYRQFTGRALATNSSGNKMQVRADNGTTYTVRTKAYIRKDQRVRVTGYLVNGVIIRATVTRI